MLFSQSRRTVIYYADGNNQLSMDVFINDQSSETKRPVFIYIHGGGFAGGERTAGYPICEFLADKGYFAVTISYTLYMKDKSFSCDGILSEKIKAIRYGVNDLWVATAWLIEHAGEYNLDTSNIFIGGSSAGAETVLHAAFWPYDMMNWSTVKLPPGFKYAGVVSGAGAIMDLNLITSNNIIPVMMFHGNCDNLVPYGTAAHHFCSPASPGWLMLFGSGSIYQHIEELGGSAKLYTYCGGGHEYSNVLFEHDMDFLLTFLTQAGNGKLLSEHHIIPTGKKCDASEIYELCK